MFMKILQILTLLVSVSNICRGQISTACYGTDTRCDYYSMQCPTSQIIKLNNLYAGYKNDPVCGINSTNHCDYSLQCCSKTPGDIIESFQLENIYSTYTNCSGRQQCTNVQAPWQLMQSLRPSLITSTYVQLEYGCETESSKIPLCGGSAGSVAGVYSYAEIMFDGSVENFDPLKASKECKCTVQNTGNQQNIVFTMIDVRLQSYYKAINDTTAVCSSALLLASNVFAAQCAQTQTTEHLNTSFYYNRQEMLTLADTKSSEISLSGIHTNGTHDSPAMVWISLKAEPGRTFSVTCEEVIPAPFTTTTTSSPSSSSSTTSSTTTTTSSTVSTTTTKPTTTTTHTTTTTSTTKPSTASTTTTQATTTTTSTTSTTTTTTKLTTTTPTTTTSSTTTPSTQSTTTPTTKTTISTPITTKPTTTLTTTTTASSTTSLATSSSTTTQSTTTSITTRPTTTSSTTLTSTSSSTPTTSTSTQTTTFTTTPTTLSITSTPVPTIPTSTPSTQSTTSSSTTSTSTSSSPSSTTTSTRSSTSSTSASTKPLPVIKPQGDGENDQKHRTAVVLAIVIPLAVSVIVVVSVMLWVFWTRAIPKRRRFRYTLDPDKLRDSKILDHFINDQGIDANSPSVLGLEKSPISSYISVPTPRTRVAEYSPNISFISNGYSTRQRDDPYTLPLSNNDSLRNTNRSLDNPVYSAYHVRLGREGDQIPIVSVTNTKPDHIHHGNIAKPFDSDEADAKSKPKMQDVGRETNGMLTVRDVGDGSVLIHVDNLSLPPLSQRSSSVNTSSSLSQAGSSPRQLTPDSPSPKALTPDRTSQAESSPRALTPDMTGSEPAVISTEPFIQRKSATAHVFPGASPQENSILFVANK